MIYDGINTVPVIMDPFYPGANSERAYTQIRRALEDLRCDIAMVTGAVDYIAVQRDFTLDKTSFLASARESGVPRFTTAIDAPEAIIVGSCADSDIIKKIIERGLFPEAEKISGKWEAFAVKEIENPVPGVGKALVIAGSDARGTIYGIYTLSEAIGVSPWYWFSDVGVKVKDKISVDINIVDEGPSVKYRGIFINDEERLIDWAKEKFPTGNGTPDVNLYRRVSSFC